MSRRNLPSCEVCGEELVELDGALRHAADGATVEECEADLLAYAQERTGWGEEVERSNGANHPQEAERAEPAR